jgi:hypothetical protein
MTMLRCLPAVTFLLVIGCARQPDPQVPAAAAAPPSPIAAAPTVSTVLPAPEPPGRTLYLCDTGQSVVVQDEGDSVLVSGLSRGEERLGRDAGGLTPQQAVFSGPTLRLEFGLGADGRQMLLQSLRPPELLHCRPR